MGTEIKTEKANYGMIRLAEALATPEETYRAAEELAAKVFPREPGTDAVMRLHGLSHQAALYVAQDAHPYRPAFRSESERIAFERGQERAQGLEEE